MTRSSAQHPQAPQMTAAAWGLLVVLGFVWGGSFFFAGYAVREVGPLTLTALRVGIAAVALWVWVIASGHRVPLDNRLWGAFAMMGLLNNAVPFSLIFWGQTEIASGLASILNATTPLFTVVLAHGLTADEKMTAGKAGGVLFGLLGVAVIMGPDAVAGLGGAFLAQAAILGAALSYAFAGIFGRRFKERTPAVTACGQVTMSSLMMAPIAFITEDPLAGAMPGPLTWAAIVALGIVSTAFAYILYFHILKVAGATNVLVVTFLVPVSAIILGVLFLGEILLARHLTGMALIGVGLVVMDGRLTRRLVSRAQ